MTEWNGMEPEQERLPEIDQPQEWPEQKAPQTQSGVVTEIYETLESFIFVISVLLVIFCFLVRPATVFGHSMVPTLQDGDRLVLWQMGYEPDYGDIVVIDRTQSDEEALVKRVIGKAGDVINIDFGLHHVWRNGELLDESYINEPTARSFDVEFPVTVPEGTVFVMGDNRNNSDDSRDSQIGMIDTRRVMGKAVFRFFPFNKLGSVSGT